METFYAKYNVYHFCYPVVDKEGKPLYKTNLVTGQQLHDASGMPIPIIKMERFENIRNKMSQGYLSKATFDNDSKDPQEIARGKALRELAVARNINVHNEEDFEKGENYDKWVEKKRRIEAEAEVRALKEKANRVDELEKKIAALQNNKR